MSNNVLLYSSVFISRIINFIVNYVLLCQLNRNSSWGLLEPRFINSMYFLWLVLLLLWEWQSFHSLTHHVCLFVCHALSVCQFVCLSFCMCVYACLPATVSVTYFLFVLFSSPVSHPCRAMLQWYSSNHIGHQSLCGANPTWGGTSSVFRIPFIRLCSCTGEFTVNTGQSH